MELTIKFDTVKSGWPTAYIEGSQVIIFNRIEYNIFFSEDWFLSQQTVHTLMKCHIYVAFHLGLHYLTKYPFWGFGSSKG